MALAQKSFETTVHSFSGPDTDTSKEHSATKSDSDLGPSAESGHEPDHEYGAAPVLRRETDKPVDAPGKWIQHAALAGLVIAFVGSFFLISGSQTMRLAALGLAFFAGGLAVWRLLADDQLRLSQALVAKDDKIRRLMERCEDLEDRAWELRESDERNTGILSSLGDIILRRDPTGTLVYANAAAHDAFGPEHNLKIGSAINLPLIDRADPADEAGTESLEAHKRFGFGDVQLNTPRGPRWYSRIDVSVRDAVTEQPMVQTVLRDVTDRRMMEEELLAARRSAESSSEAKSRFLATVSHEIRTPLNGILGMTALLRDTRLTKEQSAYIEALETSGDTLLLLIDEVLDFSKVEAGKLDIQAVPTRLTGLTEGVVELLAPKAHAKDLEIGTRIDPRLPEMVTVDAIRVRQILFNLTGNGVKFTDDGGVAIEIDGQANVSGGTDLVFKVRDTGIGFDPDEASRLFMEFEQIDHGPARKFGGTGLGLAIAQRLVRLMGGTIVAEPTTNQGAQFRVTIPIPEKLTEVPHTPAFSGKRIVFVSDSRIECPLLADRLRLDGAGVDIRMPGADDLSDLLSLADIILVDNSAVSDSGGWLASARLSGIDAPAIVLIAPSERDRLDRLREAGYSAYLIRPVRMETLNRVISGLLEAKDGEAVWDVAGEHNTPVSGVTTRRLAPARPLKLLVAEDNDINRLLSEALLRKLGHEPTVVVDGEKAVAAAAEHEFDAILMDLHMPGLDGLDAITQIRAREAKQGRDPIPVLMVTADVMQDARERAKAAGASGYLTKPLTADAIQEALQALSSSKMHFS
ncbi:PAS domain-containing sensor histidine kinase [Roseibium hamelinense]|uniref:PAS domain-containing hybrid sensor histidine kinase/response regulator n=1 Tax=Roseibium hamelinense TaxID=150831 RepID=UPI0011A57BA4|nr:PAS domain-containing hybrid sensor histidine kinase/response regulator [Roseibium hamelinense]MTI44350.1 PAS domain-containing sensor histidine kinase [Roseibium hamelinense]